MKPTLTHLSILICIASLSVILYAIHHASDDCEARGGKLVNAPVAAFVCVKEIKR